MQNAHVEPNRYPVYLSVAGLLALLMVFSGGGARNWLLNAEFLPHAYCYLLRPGLLWLHVISDALITLAYASIPITLVYFVLHRADVPFNSMFWCFAAFIVGCGATHAMEILTVWRPYYWLSGVVKAGTAVISLVTAGLLIKIMPVMLSLPSPQQLESSNLALRAEIEQRRQAEARLQASEARFRGFLESAPDAMLAVDQAGRIVLANAQAQKLFGFRLEELLGDPGQLEQVIVNLAVNARDAMPKGGKLTIETRNVELDNTYARQHISVQPGPYVLLAVTDNGTGMDAETRSRVFEPFFTTKEQGKGTGLGLATVYGIVKQSGGYIWVYSEPAQGTTFKIYLPRVQEKANHQEAAATTSPQAQASETVLMVEDEEGVRKVVRGFLEARGYRVLEAENGAEALRLAGGQNGPIHLLLTDMIMPSMNGPDLAERLRLDRPGIKVLFMSGYTSRGARQNQGLDLQAPFLEKPFSGETLVGKIREVLDALPADSTAATD